jgi:hypothetical protein
MAEVDFDGKSGRVFEKPLVKDDVYVVVAKAVDDKILSFKAKDLKTGKEKDRRRILIRWALPDGKELTQFTSVDVKVGSPQNNISPTGSYTFLEKSNELENFKKMCAGKLTIDDTDVLTFFKTRFIGRQARIATKTVKSAAGQTYSVISQFLEVMPKA